MMNLFIIIFSLFISGYVISLIYFSILTDRYNSKTSDNLFSISVIISLHNEEKNVQHLMQSLLAQKYPKDQIEFIFVNDRSVDKTGNLLDSYSKEDSQITVIHITKKQKNIAPKKFAIDSAINIAKGEIILFTDADARHDKEWAKTMTSYFTEKVGMVLGNVTYNTNRKIKSLLFRLVHLDFFSISAIGLSTVSMKYPATCIGTNMAVRKKVYEELGGYGKYKNIQSGDDDLLMQRVRDEGDWEIEYATDKRATVFTFPPTSWNQFYNQRLRFASKSFDYPIKLTASLIFLYFVNLLFLIFIILSFFCLEILGLFAIALIIKIIGESIYLSKSRSKLNSDIDLSIMPIASFFHIFYVIYFGMASQFQSYKWGE